MLHISSPCDLLSRRGFRVGWRVRQTRSLIVLKRNTLHRSMQEKLIDASTADNLHEDASVGTPIDKERP